MKINRKQLRRIILNVVGIEPIISEAAGEYTYNTPVLDEQIKSVSRDVDGQPLIAASIGRESRGQQREFVIDKNALDSNDNIVVDVHNADRGNLIINLVAINGKEVDESSDFETERIHIKLPTESTVDKHINYKHVGKRAVYDIHASGITRAIVYDGATGLGGGADSLKAGDTHTINMYVT